MPTFLSLIWPQPPSKYIVIGIPLNVCVFLYFVICGRGWGFVILEGGSSGLVTQYFVQFIYLMV